VLIFFECKIERDENFKSMKILSKFNCFLHINNNENDVPNQLNENTCHIIQS